eukprot:TRINITY_DN15949_c0_g1_i1.p1 TRINITY_DN15949_c0_g1~~TRINITY_DN15949_c0_g1_i1.p1  ORF type:complete len:410 (+),score=66.17 TRINITY_DN15949_c0_g1_i1:69-1232(+)
MVNFLEDFCDHRRAAQEIYFKELSAAQLRWYSKTPQEREDGVIRDMALGIAAVTSDGFQLVDLSEQLRKDKDVVLAALASKHGAIEFVSKSLLEETAFALEACEFLDEPTFESLSAKVRADPKVVREMMSHFPGSLKYASESLRSDKDFVMAAVKLDGASLQGAIDDLRDDFDVVLAAVSNFGLALADASSRLQDDNTIVFEACMDYPEALQFASKRIRDVVKATEEAKEDQEEEREEEEEEEEEDDVLPLADSAQAHTDFALFRTRHGLRNLMLGRSETIHYNNQVFAVASPEDLQNVPSELLTDPWFSDLVDTHLGRLGHAAPAPEMGRKRLVWRNFCEQELRDRAERSLESFFPSEYYGAEYYVERMARARDLGLVSDDRSESD